MAHELALTALWEQYVKRPHQKKSELGDIIEKIDVLAPLAIKVLLAREDCLKGDRIFVIQKRGSLPEALEAAIAVVNDPEATDKDKVEVFNCIDNRELRKSLAADLLEDPDLSSDVLFAIADKLEEDDPQRYQAAKRLVTHEWTRGDMLHWVRREFWGDCELVLLVIEHPNVNESTLASIITGPFPEPVKAKAFKRFVGHQGFTPYGRDFDAVVGRTVKVGELRALARKVLGYGSSREWEHLDKVNDRVMRDKRESFWIGFLGTKGLKLDDLYYIRKKAESRQAKLKVFEAIVLHPEADLSAYRVVDGPEMEDFWLDKLDRPEVSKSLIVFLMDRSDPDDPSVQLKAAKLYLALPDRDFWDYANVFTSVESMRGRMKPMLLRRLPQLSDSNLVAAMNRFRQFPEIYAGVWQELKSRKNPMAYELVDVIVNHPEYRAEAWQTLKEHPNLSSSSLEQVAQKVPELADEAKALIAVISNYELVQDMIKLANDRW